MNKEQMSIEDILNECLEAIMRGESEAQCLERYPAQAAELKPLLSTMMAARQACQMAPRPEFRARARYEFRRAVADACAEKPVRGLRWNWRWSTAIPIAIALMLVSGGGVVAASTNSLPGQPLYGVKLAVEQVQVNLAGSEEAKVKVYAAQAERRVDEVVALANSNKPALIGEATLRLDDTLNKVTGYMNISSISNTPRDNISGPSSPEAYPPAVAGGSTLDAKTAAEAPAPSQAVPSQTLNTSNIDPGLLQTLKDNAARGQAKLQSVIGNQPANNSIVLQHAIDSYQAILNTQAATAN